MNCIEKGYPHDHGYILRASINGANVNPNTGKMEGEIQKTYSLELFCRHCQDRIMLYTKTVGLEEDVTLEQMLTEYRASLAAEYEESKSSSRA